MRSTKAAARDMTLKALEAARAGEKPATTARRLGVSPKALSRAKTRARAAVGEELKYWTRVHELTSKEEKGEPLF